jgi:hypothetical protein
MYHARFPDTQKGEVVSLAKEMISLAKLMIFAGLFSLVRLTNIYIGHSRVSAGHAGFFERFQDFLEARTPSDLRFCVRYQAVTFQAAFSRSSSTPSDLRFSTKAQVRALANVFHVTATRETGKRGRPEERRRR